MTYEEVLSLRPKLISFDSLSFFLEPITFILSLLIIAFVVTIIYSISNGTDEREKTILKIFSGFFFLFLSTLIFLGANSSNYKNFKIWESNVVVSHIEDGIEETTDIINRWEIEDGKANVIFSVGSKVVDSNAEIVVEEDIDKPYITYYISDYDYSDKYKKGDVASIKLHMPKDIKLK